MLFIVADQFPESYFQRFEHLLSGGLARLRSGGVVFTDTKYTHAVTNTCPGHTSLATGSHPATHGIVDNRWYDRHNKQHRYCVLDADGAYTTNNTRVSSFPDWFATRYPRGKRFTVSGKDRAAIPLAGKSADGAYWYNSGSGKFDSSAIFPGHNAWWVKNFNTTTPSSSYFGTLWTPLPISEVDQRKAKIAKLDTGVFRSGFPHAIGEPLPVITSEFYADLARTPFVDTLTTQFAKQLILSERLGRDENPDYLAISYSSLDRVGHRFGPNSPEILDTLLRLDQSLDELFTFLDKEIGLDNVLISFSADHGVAPLPEYRHSLGAENSRITPEEVSCIQRISTQVEKELSLSPVFTEGLILNKPLLRTFAVSRALVDEKVRNAALQCSIVKRIWSSAELEEANAETKKFAASFLRSFDPERSPDYLVELVQYAIPQEGSETGHGSQYRYDSQVPMILLHPALEHQFVLGPAQPIDLAPTLAHILGIEIPHKIDGRSWHELLLR